MHSDKIAFLIHPRYKRGRCMSFFMPEFSKIKLLLVGICNSDPGTKDF